MGLVLIGAVTMGVAGHFSVDPFVSGVFTLVNTYLLAQLARHQQDRTDKILDKLERLGDSEHARH